METQKLMLYTIPLIEYRPVIKKPKGLFIIIHGHGSNKEEGVGEFPKILTNMGYMVVSIDAYKHGERKEEPYISNNLREVAIAMIDVVIQTTKDVLTLFNKHYSKLFPIFHIIGISMGGHIAYQLPKYTQKVQTIIPIIATPDLLKHYEISKKTIIGEFSSELTTKLQGLSLQKDLYLYQSIAILAINGSHDNVVSNQYSKAFIRELLKKGHHKAHYKEYECGHTVVKEMKDDMILFIQKYLNIKG
jgi:dienelactone hydrolase